MEPRRLIPAFAFLVLAVSVSLGQQGSQTTTFKEAGKVGLWTKADSVIQFDDFTVEGH